MPGAIDIGLPVYLTLYQADVIQHLAVVADSEHPISRVLFYAQLWFSLVFLPLFSPCASTQPSILLQELVVDEAVVTSFRHVDLS